MFLHILYFLNIQSLFLCWCKSFFSNTSKISNTWNFYIQQLHRLWHLLPCVWLLDFSTLPSCRLFLKRIKVSCVLSAWSLLVALISHPHNINFRRSCLLLLTSYLSLASYVPLSWATYTAALIEVDSTRTFGITLVLLETHESSLKLTIKFSKRPCFYILTSLVYLAAFIKFAELFAEKRNEFG